MCVVCVGMLGALYLFTSMTVPAYMGNCYRLKFSNGCCEHIILETEAG